jgi:hypothetical protein
MRSLVFPNVRALILRSATLNTHRGKRHGVWQFKFSHGPKQWTAGFCPLDPGVIRLVDLALDFQPDRYRTERSSWRDADVFQSR